MNEANYWKLGLFVVVCVVLSFAALAFLGARQFDRTIENVHFFFDEPVDGLSVGSQVRLRGIPIGNVKKIVLAPDRLYVDVMAEIDVDTLVRLGVREPGEMPDPIMTRATFVAIGIRAYLETNPLTGLSTINIDMFDQYQNQWPEYPFETPPEVIPTVTSTLKGIMGSLEGTLRELQKAIPPTTEGVLALLARLDTTLIEIEPGALAGEFREVLVTLREELESLQVAKLSVSGQDVASELQASLKEAREFVGELRQKEGAFQALLATYQELGRNLNTALDKGRLDRATEAATQAMEAIASASNEVGGLSRDIHEELALILDTLESVRSLAEQLERDPGSLLYGKTPAPLPEPREGS